MQRLDCVLMCPRGRAQTDAACEAPVARFVGERSRIGVPRRRPMGTVAFILEQTEQLARRPPRAPDAQKVCERPLLAENRRRVGTLAQVAPLARIEMSLRRAIDAERLFKLLPKRRKLGIGLSRQRQRSRRERGCSKARG